MMKVLDESLDLDLSLHPSQTLTLFKYLKQNVFPAATVLQERGHFGVMYRM